MKPLKVIQLILLRSIGLVSWIPVGSLPSISKTSFTAQVADKKNSADYLRKSCLFLIIKCMWFFPRVTFCYNIFSSIKKKTFIHKIFLVMNVFLNVKKTGLGLSIMNLVKKQWFLSLDLKLGHRDVTELKI